MNIERTYVPLIAHLRIAIGIQDVRMKIFSEKIIAMILAI